MDKRALAVWVGMGLAATGLTGCGKPGEGGEAAAAPPTAKASAMPANVVLSGQYVDGYGRGLFFTPDGGVGVIGSPDNGRYVGEGQTFRVEIAGKPPGMGHIYSPNKISVSFSTAANGTMTLFREGSDLAAQARAEANHAPVERKSPDFDRSVPLDRYQDLSPDQTAEGLFYLYAALHEPPLSDEEKFRMLSPHRGESDGFKRRDFVQAEMPGIDAKLADAKSKRYFKLTVDPKEWGLGQSSANGFPRMAYTGGLSSVLGAYDFKRKGFPATCIANERLSHALSEGWSGGVVGLVMGREETHHKNCVLTVSDEPTARAMEAKRSTSAFMLLKTADLYFYAVGDRDEGGTRDVSVVLTHARLQYGNQGGLLTDDPDPVGAPIDVDFPQPALD